ncbi:hypothetical protein J3E69DRAFT_198044 [Trichoderma sp. SZMC 28015]
MTALLHLSTKFAGLPTAIATLIQLSCCKGADLAWLGNECFAHSIRNDDMLLGKPACLASTCSQMLRRNVCQNINSPHRVT